jgi:hypothetical protein
MAAARTVSLIHIHDENTADAVNPVPTVRLATMNISEVAESSERYTFCILTAARITPQKSTPRPIRRPYAVPWGMSVLPATPIVSYEIL